MLRRLIGAELRRLREASGISREAAGFEIRSSESKISRVELGRVSFKLRDVADLLTLYGLPEGHPERERVLALVKQANAPGWWRRFSDIIPSWFEGYIGLESSASMIRTYETQLVPGLLQTRDYITAIARTVNPHATPAELKRWVELRATRQEVVLRRDPAPTLWAVIDEAALRRRVGGVPVLRGQLEALVDATQQPNIKIQISPFTAAGHAALTGAFTILRFPDEDMSDVVYLEAITRALLLDRPEEIDAYTRTMELLCVEAQRPDQTADILLSILKDLG